jgi:hypothetical protein
MIVIQRGCTSTLSRRSHLSLDQIHRLKTAVDELWTPEHTHDSDLRIALSFASVAGSATGAHQHFQEQGVWRRPQAQFTRVVKLLPSRR